MRHILLTWNLGSHNDEQWRLEEGRPRLAIPPRIHAAPAAALPPGADLIYDRRPLGLTGVALGSQHEWLHARRVSGEQSRTGLRLTCGFVARARQDSKLRPTD